MPTLGEIMAREKIGMAGAGAGDEWMDAAVRAIAACAREYQAFTTDHVWQRVPHPDEPRAMGAAVRRAQAAGIIRAAGGWVTSRRPECNARPVRLWTAGPNLKEA